MSIGNMRMKLNKNKETFKKHTQAERQIITCKNCFYEYIFYQTCRKVK